MGGRPVVYLHSVDELNSEPLKTNRSSGRESDLNPGPADYKPNALPLSHAHLPLNGRRQLSFSVLSVRFEVGVSFLLAPVGADKRGPKAPFPLVENA